MSDTFSIDVTTVLPVDNLIGMLESSRISRVNPSSMRLSSIYYSISDGARSIVLATGLIDLPCTFLGLQLLFNEFFELIYGLSQIFDHILTFSDEIEYIWKGEWSLTAFLFLFTRYFALLDTAGLLIFGESSIPKPIPSSGSLIFGTNNSRESNSN